MDFSKNRRENSDDPFRSGSVPGQAVILAGGPGTRLGKLTKNMPKPMLNVAGRPFIEYLLENLKRWGVTRVVLSVGYLADKIQAGLGDGSRLGMKFTYSVEARPLGTGGALNAAANYLEDRFFVVNGDTLFDIDYRRLASLLSPATPASIALRKVADVSRYGNIRMEGDRVFRFSEKSASGPGLANGGVYAMEKRVLRRLPPGPRGLETELFPQLAHNDELSGHIFDGFFLDIGLPDTLAEAQTLLPTWLSKSDCPARMFRRFIR